MAPKDKQIKSNAPSNPQKFTQKIKRNRKNEKKIHRENI